jgi:hypothetical protein
VECVSALERQRRDGSLEREAQDEAVARLRELIAESTIVQPTSLVRDRAERLLAVHPLRAADSLQLAAALVVCDDRPAGESFVCLDGRLREAAMREGFRVLPT